jgi:division protein CdvB (Snf7/Vps24/ESCRT-III family)
LNYVTQANLRAYRELFLDILATNFSDKWQTDRSREPVSTRIKEAVAPQGDLRKKLTSTERALTSQITKLDKTIAKMGEKEKNLFSKTSAAYQKHDTVQAHAYANELSEVRKALKLVNGAKLALESVQGRLKTITDIGDLAVVLAPAGQVIASVRRTLVNVMPSANESIGDINSCLEGLMQDIGSLSNFSGFNLENTNEEAEKILAEASVVAESKMASNFPNLDNLSTDSSSSATDTSI